MIPGLFVAVTLLAAAPGPALDAPAGAASARAGEGDATFPQGERVGDGELAEQRGGFRLGQLDIQLGVDLRSYLGGKLVARTTVSWTDVATSTSHVLPAAEAAAVANGLAASVAATGEAAIPGTLKLTYADGGQTTLVQQTDGAVRNVVINTESGVTIRQDVGVQLDIHGFAPFLGGVLAGRIGSALTTMSRLAISMRGGQ